MIPRSPLAITVLGLLAFGAVVPACRFDPSYRDFPDPIPVRCMEGAIECRNDVVARCENNVSIVVDDCGARDMACAPRLARCTPCLPDERTCDGASVLACDADGQKRTTVETCKGDDGFACRRGGCVNLCQQASQSKSNIGCEYWPVDLDNAVLPDGNAAIQQFAVIVSNPQPDLAARVTIEEDVARPGEAANVRTVATASVGVRHLEVFKLGPKEVDGSTPDKPNGGSHTALSRGAFRLRSHVPIVAYQFNPLDNVGVFSNDATILLPTAALSTTGRAYVVASWPQTIAISNVPSENFGLNLRAFLTIVGTRPDTKVHLKTNARVVAGGPFADGVARGAEVDTVLQPFDVLNLETGEFNADFTGSTIDADGPVVVYTGSEASDAPFYSTTAIRSCCADHLESQVTPIRALGRRYALGRMPNRSRAVAAAGGGTAPFAEPELYRVVAATRGVTTVRTTLPSPWNHFALGGEGESVTIVATQDFTLEADQAVLVADVQVSQEAAGISIQSDGPFGPSQTRKGLPGGDPSLLLVPPVEQWRSDYVLLTPDRYAFDFLVITAPFGANVYIDDLPVDGSVCETAPGDGLDANTRGAPNPPFTVYRCQLSFPIIDTSVRPLAVLAGKQNDGVHHVVADYPIGVLVYGFDYRVSYAYAGGTELTDINAN